MSSLTLREQKSLDSDTNVAEYSLVPPLLAIFNSGRDAANERELNNQWLQLVQKWRNPDALCSFTSVFKLASRSISRSSRTTTPAVSTHAAPPENRVLVRLIY